MTTLTAEVKFLGCHLDIYNRALNCWQRFCAIKNAEDEQHACWIVEKFGGDACIVDDAGNSVYELHTVRREGEFPHESNHHAR